MNWARLLFLNGGRQCGKRELAGQVRKDYEDWQRRPNFVTMFTAPPPLKFPNRPIYPWPTKEHPVPSETDINKRRLSFVERYVIARINGGVFNSSQDLAMQGNAAYDQILAHARPGPKPATSNAEAADAACDGYRVHDKEQARALLKHMHWCEPTPQQLIILARGLAAERIRSGGRF